MDPLLGGDATDLSTTPREESPKDWQTGLATSPIEAAAPIVPTTASVVKLTSPIALSDQTEEERWYVLDVTALVSGLNLEATGVILRDMVTALAGRVTFQNPWMAAVLPGPAGGRRVIASATVEELVGKGAE